MRVARKARLGLFGKPAERGRRVSRFDLAYSSTTAWINPIHSNSTGSDPYSPASTSDRTASATAIRKIRSQRVVLTHWKTR